MYRLVVRVYDHTTNSPGQILGRVTRGVFEWDMLVMDMWFLRSRDCGPTLAVNRKGPILHVTSPRGARSTVIRRALNKPFTLVDRS